MNFNISMLIAVVWILIVYAITRNHEVTAWASLSLFFGGISYYFYNEYLNEK